jgi:hypothetical protein
MLDSDNAEQLLFRAGFLGNGSAWLPADPPNAGSVYLRDSRQVLHGPLTPQDSPGPTADVLQERRHLGCDAHYERVPRVSAFHCLLPSANEIDEVDRDHTVSAQAAERVGRSLVTGGVHELNMLPNCVLGIDRLAFLRRQGR